ncbi:putative F-box protein At1g33530 [Apium graveolens]|uniref:putative F-box protein At1g33530 n=1 Tax=Apium graveolens TaxID=4045 RepID=UPI003D7AEE12
MSSDCTTPFFDMLTQDLISEILVRLPVKQLLRCKSVSKPWLSLISNPNFIKSHLNHTSHGHGANQILFLDRRGTSMYLLHLDSCEIDFSLGDFSFSRPLFRTAGCCNGIVCFYHARTVSRLKTNPYIHLWNPATRQAKLIPPYNIHFDDSFSLSIGFGFDSIGNDYKVVALLATFNKPCTAEVYSANTNVWRRVEPNPEDLPANGRIDVSVNGYLCCQGTNGCMMAFDLNKEVFKCRIKLPEGSFLIRIKDFDDCIAVTHSKENDLTNLFNLWKLDDEACLRDSRVEASWTLMLSIDVGRPVEFVFGYFKSGDLLLYIQEEDTLLLYNSDNKEPRNVPVSLEYIRTFKYNESLVSITGFKQVNWQAWEDDS